MTTFCSILRSLHALHSCISTAATSTRPQATPFPPLYLPLFHRLLFSCSSGSCHIPSCCYSASQQSPQLPKATACSGQAWSHLVSYPFTTHLWPQAEFSQAWRMQLICRLLPCESQETYSRTLYSTTPTLHHLFFIILFLLGFVCSSWKCRFLSVFLF